LWEKWIQRTFREPLQRIYVDGVHIIWSVLSCYNFFDILSCWESLYHFFYVQYSEGVFVSDEAYDYNNSKSYYAFHFAHLIILFIGLTFILQAILLIILVAARKVWLLFCIVISFTFVHVKKLILAIIYIGTELHNANLLFFSYYWYSLTLS
jgi:hypothetical protein